MVADIRRNFTINITKAMTHLKPKRVYNDFSGVLLALLLLLLCFVTSGSAAWAQNAWAFDMVSPAIYQLDRPVSQEFNTSTLTKPPAQEAYITAVNVQISPSASAWVDSQLCAQDTRHCVPIKGGRLYTKMFNDFPASTPFYVVHQVRSWNGAYPPVYVKTQLNLWWQ